jgi:hypothetical protein
MQLEEYFSSKDVYLFPPATEVVEVEFDADVREVTMRPREGVVMLAVHQGGERLVGLTVPSGVEVTAEEMWTGNVTSFRGLLDRMTLKPRGQAELRICVPRPHGESLGRLAAGMPQTHFQVRTSV